MNNKPYSFLPIVLTLMLASSGHLYAAETDADVATPTNPSTDVNNNPDAPFATDVSADTNAGNVKPIELQVGQRLDYSSTATLVFPADDTILAIERKNATQITLTGLKAGVTQVVFSDNGQLSHITVTVNTTISASTLLLTPEFNSRYPFLLFEFNNTSTFTDNTFFQSPAYTYNGTIESPFISRTRLRASSSYTQQSDGTTALTNGTASIVGGKTDFLFGNLDAAIGRQTNAIISSVPGYGPRLRLMNPFIRSTAITENLNLFAGVQSQTNLQYPQDGQRKAGFNYSFSKNQYNSVFQDFFNIGFVAFQPPNLTSYHYNGVLEGTIHLNSKFQLGGGAYYSNKSFGLLFTPIYQTANNLTQANLRFVRRGVEQVGGVAAPSDQHNYSLSLKKILKDRITTINATAGHQITLPTPDGTVSGSNTSNAQFGLVRQYTISRRYGGSYGFSRNSSGGIETYSNVITGYYAHPFTQQTYFQHTLSANQGNTTGASTTRQLQLNDMLQYETLNMRHQLGLTSTYSESPQKQFGIVLSGISSFFFRGSTIQLNESMTKTDILNDIYQFQFSPSILFQPTTTQLISLTSSANYTLQPQNNTLSGSINIIYRRYMGPGVVKDSLIKRIFKTSTKVRISGRVFQDVNYNNRFEEGDIGLENVPLSIDDKTKTITGPGGIFTIANIAVGQHTIVVEPSPIQGINKPVSFPIYVGSESAKHEIAIPVQEPKATITVRTILDINDNKTTDESDSLASVSHIELTQGEHTRTENASEGGAIFNGVDIGSATVTINPIDIGENLESVSPLVQTIDVADYKEYIVNFVFKAMRGLRGQVKMSDNSKLPPHLTIKLGAASVTADKDGYYWLKELKEGDFELSVTNLPRGYCVQEGNNIPIHVVSPFSAQKDLILIKCE